MFKWSSTKSRGDAGEDRALRHLQQQGLTLLERNYRVAAGPSVPAKQRRLVYAAPHALLELATPPRCRFDVVAPECERIEWLQTAFDARQAT